MRRLPRSVPSTTYSATPIAGIEMRAIASPLSGRRSTTRFGGSTNASFSLPCWRSATIAETGSCHRRVIAASAISIAPLTIITDATKRRTARMERSVGMVGYGYRPSQNDQGEPGTRDAGSHRSPDHPREADRLGRPGRGAGGSGVRPLVRRLGGGVRPPLQAARGRRDVRAAQRRQAPQLVPLPLGSRRRGARGGPHLHLLEAGGGRGAHEQLA